MRQRLASLQPALATVGSAYSNLLFVANPWLGYALLAVTLVRPASGVAGLLAAVSASLTARSLGYRVDAVRSGQYGFNAVLLGLALSVGHGFDGPTAVLCVLGGIGSALLTATFADALHRGVGLPVLALPFVVLTTALLPALHAQEHDPATQWLQDTPTITLDLPFTGSADLLLRAFGAILFQPTALAGLLVLLGCLMHSRIATVAALGGVGVALGMNKLLHVPLTGSTSLGASYNAALTAAAIGAFFFVPSRASTIAAFASAALAAWLSIALAGLLAPLGLPMLAWPFVLVTFAAVRALHLKAPDRAPFPTPLAGLSPEANLEYATMLAKRFGQPGPPLLSLPVAGTWIISQGAEGEHTHRDAWAGALDFEIFDSQNFPFRNQGLETEDYFCFSAPVHAPGTGTVAAIFDGQADGKPGEMDLARPWGNAVVIQHGPDFFSVVAHLKCGSITVKPGQFVTVGQAIAACGSSGRSPRPHLHLQAQRTAELGAPTLPFRLAHYVVETEGALQYVHAGLPEEGQRVAPAQPNPIAEGFATLQPGSDIELVSETDGSRLRFRSEISLLGERSLVDLDRGDRLFFVSSYGNVTFTSYTGRTQSPLRALFLALPRLPSVSGAQVRFEDELPPALLLSRPARWALELVRPFLDPLKVKAAVEMNALSSLITVQTSVGAALTGTIRPRIRSRVEIDVGGIRRVEVIDERHPERPLLRARRPS